MSQMDATNVKRKGKKNEILIKSYGISKLKFEIFFYKIYIEQLQLD